MSDILQNAFEPKLLLEIGVEDSTGFIHRHGRWWLEFLWNQYSLSFFQRSWMMSAGCAGISFLTKSYRRNIDCTNYHIQFEPPLLTIVYRNWILVVSHLYGNKWHDLWNFGIKTFLFLKLGNIFLKIPSISNFESSSSKYSTGYNPPTFP